MTAFRRLSTACLLLAIITAACAPSAPPGAQSPQSSVLGPQSSSSPKRITTAIRGFPRSVSVTLDSAGAGATAGMYEVEQLVNAGLTVVDTNGEPQPRLAKAVPSTANGLWKVFPDGRMETTWNLQPGVVWHDGTPFTAADLVFTAGVGRDKDLPIEIDPPFEFVDSVEALGRGLSLEQGLQVRDLWRDGRVEMTVTGATYMFPQFTDPNPAGR